jgi:hypothetical protein
MKPDAKDQFNSEDRPKALAEFLCGSHMFSNKESQWNMTQFSKPVGQWTTLESIAFF